MFFSLRPVLKMSDGLQLRYGFGGGGEGADVVRLWPCDEACWLHVGDARWVTSLVVRSTAGAVLKKPEVIGCRCGARAVGIDGGTGHGCSGRSTFYRRVASNAAGG
jgi:hypothetical protein